MGIGSKLKKIARKIIPKEVSAAAPVVGIFNPALGAALGAAGGIREGNIGKAALQGLGAFGIGKVAQGMGAPLIGGNISSGLGSILQNIPGVSQLAASPVGQGIGSVFDKAEQLGTQLMSPGIKSSTAGGTMLEGGQSILTPEGNIVDSVTGQLVRGVLPGDIIGTGAGDITRAQILKSLLGFGLGYFGDKQAQDEYKERMARAGFDDTLDELKEQYPGPRVFESTPLNYAANGGIIGLADGGEPAMDMDYRGGGFIPVGAKERADDVPARLSKNEFVMTADAVRAAGGGNVNKGAKKMYSLMNALEARA